MNELAIIKTLMADRKKLYIIIAVAVVVIVAVWLMLRKRNKSDNEDLPLNTGNLTYPLQQYTIFADDIEVALDDKDLISAGWLGVNQKAIYNVMDAMQTNDDVLQLINAYGVRRHRKTYTLFSSSYNLQQALRKLLTNGELAKVNEILAENGITYRF